jgi:hypothetical protein
MFFLGFEVIEVAATNLRELILGAKRQGALG